MDVLPDQVMEEAYIVFKIITSSYALLRLIRILKKSDLLQDFLIILVGLYIKKYSAYNA